MPGVPAAALAPFFTPDVAQEEFPNRLTPNGARRDLAALLAAATGGAAVMAAQRYAVESAVAGGDQAALEVRWTGTLAVPVGSLPAGAEMRARFAVFLTYRDWKIARQRNYDSFEAF